MSSDVQKMGRSETFANLLSLFNENPENFISRFVTVDKRGFITSILKIKETCHFSISQKISHSCVLMSARKVMASVFWDSEETVYWLTFLIMTALLQEFTTLI